MRGLVCALIVVLATACSDTSHNTQITDLDALAEGYVRLALALGERDEHYVDAYFGDPEWREQAATEALSLEAITSAATNLAAEIRAVNIGDDELLRMRQDFLVSHLESLATVAGMRNGETLSFDEESRRVYGFVAPSFPVEHYDAVLQELDALLPGEGELHERVNAFDKQFHIPADTYEAVVRAGIEECRTRTLQKMQLPEGEEFVLELVSGNPWGAYNWYQGGYQGLIQVETSRPLSLFSSTRLGCHEGYPGHHTFSSLLEQEYLQKRGWIEFSVLPLYSPMAVIFEGSGNFAEKVAFPGPAKTKFVREVIAPIAGIEDADFDAYLQIGAARTGLRYARIEAARNYLDGTWDKQQTETWMRTYGLTPPENIESAFGFFDRYRAYVINYVLGEDLVADYVREQNPDADNDGDWEALAKLLSYPPAPMLFKSE